MNWKFWQKTPAKEEDEMGLYLRREETPADAWQRVLGQENQYPDEQEPEAPEEEAPPEEQDPLATASPEIQAAVEARLAQDRQGIRARLAQQGFDLTADGQPVIRDARRAQEWIGAPQYQAPPAQPPPAQPVAQAAPPPDDEPIPDPQYDPAGYRRWHQQELTRMTTEAMQSVLAPLVEKLQRVEQRTAQTHIDTAISRLDAAIEQYAPWLLPALQHPEFEPMFRRGLASVPPEQYGSLQELAGLASYAATQLPPLETPYQAPQRAFRPPQSQAPPPQPQQPARNEQGQFLPRAGRAAIGRAAAEATAPSRGGGRVPVQQQYDELVIQAAARLGISPEEARLTLQDSTGDASEQLRRTRLEKLR
jgi:hypothetical protein